MRDAVRRTPMLNVVGRLVSAAELRAWLEDGPHAAAVAGLPAGADHAALVRALNAQGGVPTAVVDWLIARFPEHEIEIIESCADAPPPIRVESLGLALAGGGFRAAAFHLGALDLLEVVGLRGRVRRLSTVSGGTLFGVAYARAAGRADFRHADFGSAMQAFLGTHDLVGAMLAEVRGGASTLPVALAEALSRTELVGGATLGEVELAPGQLEQVSFNATDLHLGLPFRFVRGADGQRRLGGNRAFPLTDAHLQAVRLADIAASSTCVTAGLGPLQFPDEFGGGLPSPGWPAAPLGVPLVDGALLDSDAVDGLRLGNQTGADPDLVIVADAASLAPVLRRGPRIRRLGLPALAVGVGVFVAWAWALWLEVDSATMPGSLGTIHGAIAIAWGAAAVLGLGLVIALAARWARGLGGLTRLLATVLVTPVGALLRQVMARVAVQDVVPRVVAGARLRRATLDDLHGARGSVVSAPLPALLRVPEVDAAVPAPSEFVRALAASADTQSCGIGFADPAAAARVRACGHATLCYALLSHLERNRWSATDDSDALRARLSAEWARVNACTEPEQVTDAVKS